MIQHVLNAKVLVKDTVEVGEKILYNNMLAIVIGIKNGFILLEANGNKFKITKPDFFNVIDEVLGVKLTA
jgi:hypothetical protein